MPLDVYIQVQEEEFLRISDIISLMQWRRESFCKRRSGLSMHDKQEDRSATGQSKSRYALLRHPLHPQCLADLFHP